MQGSAGQIDGRCARVVVMVVAAASDEAKDTERRRERGKDGANGREGKVMEV